jgi:ADP-ribose pyrophosphatase
MDFKVKETQKTYHGSRIVVYRDFVEQPDGSEVARELVVFNSAAAIVPLMDDGRVILIRQFRYPAKGTLVEIPAGVMNDGEDPEQCARREVEEEIGFRAGKLTWLGKVYTSPGVCTETIDLFLAEELEKTSQDLDHGEIIEPLSVGFDEALAMVATGEIMDAKSICGLLLAKGALENRRAERG